MSAEVSTTRFEIVRFEAMTSKTFKSFHFSSLKNMGGLLPALLLLGSVACSTAENTPPLTQPERIPVQDTPPPELNEDGFVADPDPVLFIDRSWQCDPSAVDPELVIPRPPDSPAHTLVLRRSGDEPCNYDLLYRDESGTTKLNETPGAYLFALTTFDPNEAATVCATNIHHTDLGRDSYRETTRTTLECASRVNGIWSRLQTVVDPGTEWAAWIQSSAWMQGSADTFGVLFARDSTFQFGNTGTNGRPEMDGAYAMRIQITSDGFSEVMTEPWIPPASSSPMDGTDSMIEEWVPTEEEKERYGHFLDFSGLEEDEEPGLEDDGGASGADGSGM